MAKRKVTEDTTVYSSAAWWSDCDPSMQVIALTKKKCETLARKMMKEAAREAWYSDDGYDGKKTLGDFMDDIRWSGVHGFTLKDVVKDHEMPRAIKELEDDGCFYLGR